jgi:hypothetical protein
MWRYPVNPDVLHQGDLLRHTDGYWLQHCRPQPGSLTGRRRRHRPCSASSAACCHQGLPRWHRSLHSSAAQEVDSETSCRAPRQRSSSAKLRRETSKGCCPTRSVGRGAAQRTPGMRHSDIETDGGKILTRRSAEELHSNVNLHITTCRNSERRSDWLKRGIEGLRIKRRHNNVRGRHHRRGHRDE